MTVKGSLVAKHDPDADPSSPYYVSVLVRHNGGRVNVKYLTDPEDRETRFHHWVFTGTR